MDNVIQIEIAQRDSESVFSNGDFINDLAVPVVLEEGDQIVLNKTFIDTTAEDSGLIDIDADITVKLGVLPYVTAETDEKFEELRQTGTNVPKDNVDYFPLRIQSNKTDPDSTHNLENAILISEIAFYFDNGARKYKNFGADNNPLILYYYDINDHLTEMAFNIPRSKTDTDTQRAQLFPVSIVAIDKFKQTGLSKFKSDSYRDGIGVLYDGGSTDQGNQPKYLTDLWAANGCRAETMTHDQQNAYNSKSEDNGGFGVSKFGTLGDEIDVACSLEQDLFSLDIKQGQYTPLEMTTLLNNAFVQNYTNNQFSYGSILESVFLKYSIPYVDPGNTKPATKSGLVFSGTFIFTPGTGNNRTKNHMLVSNGGFPDAAIDVDNSGRSFGYNPNLFTSLSNNYVCGTDSIEIEYDDETSLFYWKQLHNPIYSVGQGTPVTQVARRIIGDQPNPFTYFIRSKAGGVCFTSMYACLQSNPETGYDFWSGKLGFNVPKMTVSDARPGGGIADYKTVTIGTTVVTFSSPSIIDGIHTTNAVHTIDGLTNKTGNKYREIPSEPDNAGNNEDTVFPEVQSNNNMVIFAERSTVNNNQVIRTDTNSGYYLIEMIAGFNNTMVGSNKTEKNIHGIVNRYFNRNSYTSSTEQDSLVYTHRGAPLILSSIRTRILLPNRTVPSNIGEDNTIFLQVVKAAPPPQILQTKK